MRRGIPSFKFRSEIPANKIKKSLIFANADELLRLTETLIKKFNFRLMQNTIFPAFQQNHLKDIKRFFPDLKMNSVKILDCTLRDGGYQNNWDFSDASILKIINSLIEGNIDIIECGFLSDSKGQKKDSTQFNSIDVINNLINHIDLEDNSREFVVMVNYGDYNLNNLTEFIPEDNNINGIRLAFHKNDFKQALDSAKLIKKKGYKLYVQAMVTQTYSDLEILNMLDLYANLEPYAIYIVDSFGSMSMFEFERLYSLFNHNISDSIKLGFHSHNNMQLSYSIAIEFIEIAKKRDIIIDSSIFGMGRGAGNLNTEILANYLNSGYSSEYRITPLLEVIDGHLEFIFQENPWGYSVSHFLSAVIGCHPNYPSYFLDKKNLSIVSIKELLWEIPAEKRKKFDKLFSEELYRKYQSRIRSDLSTIDFDFSGNNILIIASGSSVKLKELQINSFIKKNKPMVIQVNHINPSIKFDYLFFSNQKRYDEFLNTLNHSKLIVTSNIDLDTRHEKCIVLEYKKLVSMTSQRNDNSTILLLNYLVFSKIVSVYLAGFDGFNASAGNNYSYKEYGRVLKEKELKKQNELNRHSISEISEKIKIRFLTNSIFEKATSVKILGVIPARYESSRFEGKPLALIHGVPMIERTYRQAVQSTMLDNLIIATDDKRIANLCKSRSIPVMTTSAECKTGTDRIAEVAEKLDYDLYINIQGDEPIIDPRSINLIVDSFKKNGNKYSAYNLYKSISDESEILSDSIIKVIINSDDELIYMSRHPIPFSKSGLEPVYFKQVCVYGFTKNSLMQFANHSKTVNEKFEDIEILRFIDLGLKVKMVKTEFESVSVDYKEDVIKVESILKSNNSAKVHEEN